SGTPRLLVLDPACRPTLPRALPEVEQAMVHRVGLVGGHRALRALGRCRALERAALAAYFEATLAPLACTVVAGLPGVRVHPNVWRLRSGHRGLLRSLPRVEAGQVGHYSIVPDRRLIRGQSSSSQVSAVQIFGASGSSARI